MHCSKENQRIHSKSLIFPEITLTIPTNDESYVISISPSHFKSSNSYSIIENSDRIDSTLAPNFLPKNSKCHLISMNRQESCSNTEKTEYSSRASSSFRSSTQSSALKMHWSIESNQLGLQESMNSITQNEDQYNKLQRRLCKIKEESEVDVNSQKQHMSIHLSDNLRVQTRINKLRFLVKVNSVSQPEKDNIFGGVTKKIQDDFYASQRDNSEREKILTQQESQLLNEQELQYQKMKQIIFVASEKLLQRKTLTQKLPIFREEDYPSSENNKNTTAKENIKFSILQNRPTSIPNVVAAITNLNLRYISESNSSSITNFENMIFHIFSSPQSSIIESISLIQPQDLISSGILHKKVQGIIDIWKKKLVYLSPDRLCYQNSKSSPLSTISFRHFSVSISKERYENVFSLEIYETKKKYYFSCVHQEQTDIWVKTIADIIILNSIYPKYKLYSEYASIYIKKQVCSYKESLSILNTGDLIIYQFTNSGEEMKLGVIIRTKFSLQVCYYCPFNEITSYPVDTFLSLPNMKFISCRCLQQSIKSPDSLTEEFIKFINMNKDNLKSTFYTFIHSIFTQSQILKPKTPSKLFAEEETFKTNKLNLFTNTTCIFSDEMYIILPKHVQELYENSLSIHGLFTNLNQIMSSRSSFSSNSSPEGDSPIESISTSSQSSQFRHKSLIPISYQHSFLSLHHRIQNNSTGNILKTSNSTQTSIFPNNFFQKSSHGKLPFKEGISPSQKLCMRSSDQFSQYNQNQIIGFGSFIESEQNKYITLFSSQEEDNNLSLYCRAKSCETLNKMSKKNKITTLHNLYHSPTKYKVI